MIHSGQYWNFQGHPDNAKVDQQEISELTNLASGLLAFEKTYCHTHGTRTPVFRLLSMINSEIAEHIASIERKFVNGDLKEIQRTDNERTDNVPF